MEFEESILDIKNKINTLYHACLGAKQLNLLNIDSHLNLKNAFSNSLQQIASAYYDKKTNPESNPDFKTHFQISCKMLNRSIEQAISNLLSDTGKTLDELIEVYNSIAQDEAKSNILKNLKKIHDEIKEYIEIINKAQSELQKADINLLDKSYLKHLGFKNSYPSALERVKSALEAALEKHINIRHISNTPTIELTDDLILVLTTEVIESLMFPKMYMKDFECLVKFSIELEERPNQCVTANVSPDSFTPLLNIILNIKNESSEMMENIDVTGNKNKILKLINDVSRYLHHFTNEIERDIILTENNLADTVLLLKDASRKHPIFKNSYLSRKDIAMIIDDIELLGLKSKSLIRQKHNFYTNANSLDQRLKLKIEGFECYQIYEKCRKHLSQIKNLKDILIDLDDVILSDNLRVLKKQYILDKKNNDGGIFELVLGMLSDELNLLKGTIEKDIFKHFCNDLLDGYYFYEIKRISSDYISETAYACLNHFEISSLINFIIENLDNFSKNNIDNCLALSEEVASIALSNDPDQNTISAFQNLLNTLLARRYHKYAYKIHVLLQEAIQNKSLNALSKSTTLPDLSERIEKLASHGKQWSDYTLFINELSKEINQTFHYYSRILKPSDIKSSKWQIEDIKYNEKQSPLQSIISFSENLSIFAIQSILLIQNNPRYSLTAIDNLYQFYVDLIAELIKLNEFNGVLSLYSALTSPAISNLSAYLKMPITEQFENLVNFEENGIKNLINLEKDAIHPTLYLAFLRSNEIDFDNKNLPSLFARSGQFLKTFFKGVNTDFVFSFKPALDEIVADNNQGVKWINDRAIQSGLDVEEYFLNISVEINPPLNELMTIEDLGANLLKFYKRDKILRFNNNEDINDILRHLLFIIESNVLQSFNSAVETVSLICKFSDQTNLPEMILKVLEIYKNTIKDELNKEDLTTESKTAIILFYKEFRENYLLTELLSHLPHTHPLHAASAEINRFSSRFSFIEKGAQSLSHPKVIALQQMISKIEFTTINILPESIKFFITHFDMADPAHSEMVFNQFIVDSIRNELAQTVSSMDAIIHIPAIIKFINLPVQGINQDEAIAIVNEMLQCTKDTVNFESLERYVQFLEKLKQHFSNHKLLFSAFSEGHLIVSKIGQHLKMISDIEAQNKDLIDEDQSAVLYNISKNLENIAYSVKSLNTRYTLETIPLLIDELNSKSAEFNDCLSKIDSFNHDLDEDRHLSDVSQFLSLSFINDPIYHLMHIYYLKELKDELENTTPNQNNIIQQSIETNLLALTSRDYKEAPIKLYKSTILIAREDNKIYSDFYSLYLSKTHSADESKVKLILSFSIYFSPVKLLDLILSNIFLMKGIALENALFFLDMLSIEKIISTEIVEKKIKLLSECLTLGNLNHPQQVLNIMSKLEKLSSSTLHPASSSIQTNNSIHLLNEFNQFIKSEKFNVEVITDDLNKILSAQFAQSSLIPMPDYQSTPWCDFILKFQFALRNYYAAYFSPTIRSKIISLFLRIAEQAALDQNFTISDLFIDLIKSEPIKDDLAAFKLLSKETVVMIDKLQLVRKETLSPTMIPLFEIYEEIDHIKKSMTSFDDQAEQLSEICYKLYIFHLHAIKESIKTNIQTDIFDFTKQFSKFLPVHESNPNWSSAEYIKYAYHNISPLINNYDFSIKNISIFFKNATEFSLCHSKKNKTPTCISGNKAKVKIFTAIKLNYSKMYDAADAGSIDQIQTLVRDFLTLSQLFEDCLIRNKLNPSPQIDKLNTYILHPELIQLNKWYQKNRRLKKTALFKIAGKDPELDALWRVHAIIEKLSVIDKLTKKIGSKLSIEKILGLKSVQRRMMAIAFEIKETYDRSQAEVNAGRFSTFDNLDVFHWTRNFHKLEDEINVILGIHKKEQMDNQPERWSWRFALEKLGILRKQDLSLPPSEKAKSDVMPPESEAAPYLSMFSNESARQEQLINSLQSLLEGPLDSTSAIKEERKQKDVLPFSTPFLINSFMQSFDWASDDLRVSIPEMGQHPDSINLLGSPQYIPPSLQLEVVNLVLVTMDMISKLAGTDGEYAPLNAKKIDNLVTIITHANDAINRYFIDTKAPPTSDKINELIHKFKTKKDKLTLSNAALYKEASEGLSSAVTLNPSANAFLRHNEQLMHQMLTENIFDLEYVSVLSPATESLSLQEAIENDPETEALLDLLLNQENETSSGAEDGQVAH